MHCQPTKGTWRERWAWLSSETSRAGLSFPLSCLETLGKFLQLSESQFPHLERGILMFFCLIKLLWGLSKLKAGKRFFTLPYCANISIVRTGDLMGRAKGR